jgi:polysaccharide pyruvyl transferase WcaK-like protein
MEVLSHGQTLFAATENRQRNNKLRIAVSTQGISSRNGQEIVPVVLNYCVELFRKLAQRYQCALVCHYIDELDELAPLFSDVMEIYYSCDAKDYISIYDGFDLTVTTRVHGAGLCASLGIPGFVISHSQRSATAEGFLAELIRPATESVEDVMRRIELFDIAAASQRLLSHKETVQENYRELLKPALEALGILKTTS